jgi:hypothetical protein
VFYKEIQYYRAVTTGLWKYEATHCRLRLDDAPEDPSDSPFFGICGRGQKLEKVEKVIDYGI